MSQSKNRAALFALVLVAFNLRWPITSVPTVLKDIQSATGAGEVAMGALTTLPILCMGLLAFLAPRLASRFGAARTVWGGLSLIVIAPVLRISAETPGVLVASVLCAGIGIAIVGGLVPGIVKEQLPDRIGLVTGIWTAVMTAGASLGAALTVPLGDALGSWKYGLVVWVIPALIAWLVWGFVEQPHRAVVQRKATSTLADLPWVSTAASRGYRHRCRITACHRRRAVSFSASSRPLASSLRSYSRHSSSGLGIAWPSSGRSLRLQHCPYWGWPYCRQRARLCGQWDSVASTQAGSRSASECLHG